MIEVNFEKTPIVIIDKNQPDKAFHFSSWQGVIEFAKTQEQKKPEVKAEKKFTDGNKITSVALSWVGKDFNPGQKEQCCNFVREVLKGAGYSPGVSREPSDGYIDTGYGFANSLAGSDIGKRIEKSELQPGDLVFFENTYGNYPSGTITHIGIYTGNGYFVHRPTVSKPVVKEDLNSYGYWNEGRRLFI